MSGTWAVYIRRSAKKEGDADVSDETQEAVARSRIPAGATVLVYSDSGGHNSGFSADRPAYQRMLADLRADRLTGIAAYNQSRFNRSAENDLALLRECAAHGVRLSVGDGEQERDTHGGKMVYGINAVVNQSYRDQASDTMRAMMRRTFEDGGHRGNDPLGYVTLRDERFRVVHPRTLVIDPDGAAVVRRVFALLRNHSFSDAPSVLNAEGAPHGSRNPWATSAVKDVWRRREVYLGNVVSKRGLEVLPGRHPALLSEAEVRDATGGVTSRKRHTDRSPAHAKRVYVLRGLVWCSCGARMRGDTRSSRGRSWSYYLCPVAGGRTTIAGPDGQLVECHAGRGPATTTEALLKALSTELREPEGVVEAARAELVRRLHARTPGVADRERARMKARLEQLRKQNEWGDLTDTEYRGLRSEAEAAIAALPDHESKLIAFDAARAVVRSLPESLAIASPERQQELFAHVVERIVITDRQVAEVTWRPEVRPFLASADDALRGQVRPRTDSNRRRRP